MKHRSLLASAVVLSLAAALGGCGSSREVEVTGSVSAASSVSGEIALEFFDVNGEGADRELTSVHTAKLQSPGDFTEKVELEGEIVLVRAIADSNGDGKCSEGEQWGEAEASIKDDDTVDPITVSLAAGACPAK
jgi:hypothetical protein